MEERNKNEKNEIFNDEINLGYGISECLQYLEKHKNIMNDGIQSDDEDDIDIDRYDDLGKKIEPFQQYKMMCHRFHGKKPKKSKEQKASKTNKLKAMELLKIRKDLQDKIAKKKTDEKKKDEKK